MAELTEHTMQREAFTSLDDNSLREYVGRYEIRRGNVLRALSSWATLDYEGYLNLEAARQVLEERTNPRMVV